ncbi:unnamed protein product [Schistocephalus solidus]|uniref:Reverse transcriptase domain-containing protein n=1 Tax=Schistocephalus solidus TaxID=70667 RepID=A0A183SGL2_SCHSO|nr:unnamed protein product [Schistocephalus solidus]
MVIITTSTTIIINATTTIIIIISIIIIIVITLVDDDEDDDILSLNYHHRELLVVPQGSVLGPLLFLVNINDCVDYLGCSTVMFADDAKLWRVIRSDSDRHASQEDLNSLCNWSSRWLLNVNVGKCVVLRLRTRRASEEDDSYQYILNGQPLSIAEEQKDLGVLIKSSLQPALQWLKAAKRAIQIDKELFRKTYGAFVRSPLEYAIQTWRPWFKEDYIQLGRMQARATKMVKNLRHLHYETRLAEIDLFPLNYRLLRGDLIQTYRIVRGKECALEFADFFELAGTENLRGHPFKLQRKLVHMDVHQNAFSQRIVGAWNELPDEDQAETLLRHETDQSSLNDHYVRFLSELQKNVLDFSKRYRKLVSNFNPKGKGNEDLTYNACLLETLKPLQDTGAAFEQYANELLKSVIEPMKKAVEKEKKQIEKVNADYLKLVNKREHERRKLDDTWRAHVLALKEKQKYQQLNTQAQQDMSLSREELKKSEMAYNGKVKAFKDSQQTYAADMTKYNSFQRHFYAHNIYNVITELESLDSQRAACSRSLLLTCATLGQSMAKQVEEASSSFAASAEKIDPDKSKVLAARDVKCGLSCRPPDWSHREFDAHLTTTVQSSISTMSTVSYPSGWYRDSGLRWIIVE